MTKIKQQINQPNKLVFFIFKQNQPSLTFYHMHIYGTKPLLEPRLNYPQRGPLICKDNHYFNKQYINRQAVFEIFISRARSSRWSICKLRHASSLFKDDYHWPIKECLSTVPYIPWMCFYVRLLLGSRQPWIILRNLTSSDQRSQWDITRLPSWAHVPDNC